MQDLDLLITRDDNNYGMFVCLRPRTPALITPTLVKQLRNLQNSIADRILSNSYNHYYYVVWYLENITKSSWNGLAFDFIVKCIKNHNEVQFEDYIDQVFNLFFLNYIGLGLPVINCSIIGKNLTGIANDFFLLNKLCFIQDNEAQEMSKIELFNEFPKLVFDRGIYQKNLYFKYHTKNLFKIRTIMEATQYDIPTTEEINNVRLDFDQLKKETIQTIYTLASKNIKILDRLARISG